MTALDYASPPPSVAAGDLREDSTVRSAPVRLYLPATANTAVGEVQVSGEYLIPKRQRVAVMSTAAQESVSHSFTLRALAAFGVASAAIGFIIGVASPGAFWGVLFPAGIAVWMATGFVSDAIDRKRKGRGKAPHHQG